MTPIIREATAADAAALTECFRRAYAQATADIPDLPDVAAGLADDIAQHHVLIAANSAGHCLGGIVFSVDPPDAHLVNVATDPDARGLGLGKHLVSEAETRAAAVGARTMHLATHQDMPQNVVIYERLGWSVTAREGSKVLMSKRL